MPTFSFEIKHRVHHVLQHPRAGDDTFLCHMADQDQHKAAPFGEAYQLLRGPAHLAHRTGGAVQRVEIHGLDRIDDHQTGRVIPVERGDDVAHAAGGGQQHRALGDPKALGAQPNLIDRLLAGDVGGTRRRCLGLPRRRCHRRRGLEQQGRFADPRISAHQNRRAGNKPAAADAIEFGNAGSPSGRQHARPGQADKTERAPAATVLG